MGYALKYEQVLNTENCCNCAMEFAMPADFQNRKRADESTFYCPNGHGQSYNGESDAAKIKRLETEKMNAEASKRLAERLLEENKLKHQRELKRRDRRAHAGICQKCNRTFKNVARHMETKHSA